MGRLNTFEIFLLNQYGQVDAGSVLNGQIVLDCSEDMEIKEIIVHCFGKCRVQWVDTRAAAPLAEVQAGITPPVNAEENYINEFLTCFPKREEGQPDRAINRRLTKGMHTFDFAFQIPTSAPASFAAEHGFIKYVVRAQVHLPNKVENNVRYFTVRPVFDLNRVPNVEESVQKKDEVEVTSLLRHWGKCQAKMSIPKKGFVHGDTIPITVKINNESNKELNKARLRLRMVTKYCIKSQTCISDRILAESKLAPITGGYTFNSCDRCLQIPKDIPASHLHGCKFMHVKYYVELFLRPTLLSVKKLRMSIKIHVGTIPISLAREQAYLRMREAPPKYDELPPSYRDAIRNHLTEVQLNGVSNQNASGGASATSSGRLAGCASSKNNQCQNAGRVNQENGASCSNNNHNNNNSNNNNNNNTNCSDLESLCSSLDSLISDEEAESENTKPTARSSRNLKFYRQFIRRPVDFQNGNCAEDLRIAVLRRNLDRAREELSSIRDQNASAESTPSETNSNSKKSLSTILNSFFMSFPFMACNDMKL